MKDSTSTTGNTENALAATGSPGYSLYPAATAKVCNMEYLNGITRGDEKKTCDLVDAFVTEINEDLALLKIAIEKTNYPEISNISHNMKSAFAILGIKILEPVVKEMEQLSNKFSSIEIIKKLSRRIQFVFYLAKVELEKG